MNKITIPSEDIVKMVCEYFQVKPSEVFKNSRKRTFAYPRQIIQYFHTKYTNLSYVRIGLLTPKYGRKQAHDHASITHSKKTIEHLLESRDNNTMRDILSLEQGFKMLYKDSATGRATREARKHLLNMELINQRIEITNLKDKIKSIEKDKITSIISKVDLDVLELLKDMSYEAKREAVHIIKTKKKVSQMLNLRTA